MTGEFKLRDAKPWGRNRAEYTRFFDLADLPPGRRMLDCAAGPSSFTAEMAGGSTSVVAADPLYRFSKAEIETCIQETRGPMMAGVRAAAHRFLWDEYGTPEALEVLRLSAMKFFLEDYEAVRAAGRYVAAALPKLPFADTAFDCSLRPTSCSCTPRCWTRASTSSPPWNSAGSRPRCASSRSWT